VNDENLKGYGFDERTASEQREIAQKGGTTSGKVRRKKADMRKAVQDILDGNFTLSNERVTGAEAMAKKLFALAMEKNGKQNIAAMKLILELTGQDKDTLTDKKTKAEIKLLETKIKALSGLDETEYKKLLDNINKILNDVDSVIE
jgi:nitrate reductase alpha subunit